MENDINIEAKEFEEDRYSRLRLIPWWNQERLTNANIMVVGAGALGNEIIKNLALLGIGTIKIFDIDKIEDSNLTRSVLFRAKDVGRYKAEVAAERAMEINPDIKAEAYNQNIITEVGLGVFKEADIVMGGLDNREARLAINQACYKVNKPWIDGAIEALNGFARVFVPGKGACYECTMTETDWALINKRKSCALLTHEELNEGKIPTTPTSSSVIAGVQVQEMLKLLHSERDLPTLVGKGFVFNGLTHDSYVVEYQEKSDCMSHTIYNPIIKTDWSVKDETLKDALDFIKSEMGDEAYIEFDKEIATYAHCSKCGKERELFKQVNMLKGKDVNCEDCDQQMQFDTMHVVKGDEKFIDKTFADLTIPSRHIIAGKCGSEVKYFEFEK